jgi:hypothetical protein
MPVAGANAQITAEVLSWPHTSAAPHRFGGVEYRIGRREIGHIHGDSWLDIPFPTAVRRELIEAGQAEPHHLLPASGWITFYLRQSTDVAHALALLHRSYTLAAAQLARRKGNADQHKTPMNIQPEDPNVNH